MIRTRRGPFKKQLHVIAYMMMAVAAPLALATSTVPLFRVEPYEAADHEGMGYPLKVYEQGRALLESQSSSGEEPKKISDTDYRFDDTGEFGLSVAEKNGYRGWGGLFGNREPNRNPYRLRWTSKGGYELLEEIRDESTNGPRYYSFLSRQIVCASGHCHIESARCALQVPSDLYPEAVRSMQALSNEKGEAKKGSDLDAWMSTAYELYLRALTGDADAAHQLQGITGDNQRYELAERLRKYYEKARQAGCRIP